MSTPGRLVELRCPECQESHWEIDCDYRGAALFGGIELSYPERSYFCPRCQTTRLGYAVLQKSPPEFFLQPHHMYPMTEADFDHWVRVLRENFPTHKMLSKINQTWYPYSGPAWQPRGS